MKKLILFLTVTCTIFSCDKPEYGTTDLEILSKKLFDTFRDNDMQKSAFLLPDKGTYRKIEADNNHEYADINKAYDAFISNAENNFNTLKSKTDNWEKCKYERSITSDSKMGKLAVSAVVVKFDNDGIPAKFEFTAIKFNNRWFYYGDAKWVEKAPVN